MGGTALGRHGRVVERRPRQRMRKVDPLTARQEACPLGLGERSGVDALRLERGPECFRLARVARRDEEQRVLCTRRQLRRPLEKCPLDGLADRQRLSYLFDLCLSRREREQRKRVASCRLHQPLNHGG